MSVSAMKRFEFKTFYMTILLLMKAGYILLISFSNRIKEVLQPKFRNNAGFSFRFPYASIKRYHNIIIFANEIFGEVLSYSPKLLLIGT